MSYILIQSNDDFTSQERAELITRELYNITAPEVMQHDYQADGTVFGLVEHPDGGDWAMHIQEDWVIYCHDDVDLDRLVGAFPEVPADEVATLRSLIESSDKVTFSDIIPSTATVRDYDYMVDNGWFTDEI
jgi:hypothetical protein|tara:strand:- start:4703 stop:5095 length:393 start_codon:yes stop_codon:yes gene_type:complete